MAQAALECANAALRKIGHTKIAALDTSSETSTLLLDRIDICKRTLLRMHPWNFAVKRKLIEPTWVTISNAVTNGGLIRLTATTHGRSTGDRVTVRGVFGVPANGTWYVTVIDVNTLDLQDSVFSGTYEAGDDDLTKAAQFEYDYEIALPSDCLRVLRVNDTNPYDYRIEAGKIVTNQDEIEIKYVYDVTDYTTMDILFYELLSHYLAWDISYRVTQSSQLKEQLFQEMRVVMKPFAKFVDATEDPAEKLQADEWVNSRFGGQSSWQDVGRY
jgi:hypothetical protein